jgi:hypothetical protein
VHDLVDRFVNSWGWHYIFDSGEEPPASYERHSTFDESATPLIDYARRKYAEERWPLAPELRAVREAIEKLRATPVPAPKPVGRV